MVGTIPVFQKPCQPCQLGEIFEILALHREELRAVRTRLFRRSDQSFRRGILDKLPVEKVVRVIRDWQDRDILHSRLCVNDNARLVGPIEPAPLAFRLALGIAVEVGILTADRSDLTPLAGNNAQAMRLARTIGERDCLFQRDFPAQVEGGDLTGFDIFDAKHFLIFC